jgi:hypothetical protein
MEKSGLDVKLTTHQHLVLRLRMHGHISQPPSTPSWRGDNWMGTGARLLVITALNFMSQSSGL